MRDADWGFKGSDAVPADVRDTSAGILEEQRLRAQNAADSRLCGKCGCVDVRLRRCERCKSVWYCSKDCQVQHWHQHRSACARGDAGAGDSAVSA
eukprot:gene58194-biopygen67750